VKNFVRLQQRSRRTRAPSKGASFNEFGLVCITRSAPNSARARALPALPYCTGPAWLNPSRRCATEIQAEARKMAMPTKKAQTSRSAYTRNRQGPEDARVHAHG